MSVGEVGDLPPERGGRRYWGILARYAKRYKLTKSKYKIDKSGPAQPPQSTLNKHIYNYYYLLLLFMLFYAQNQQDFLRFHKIS